MNNERARIIGLVQRRIAAAQHEAATRPYIGDNHPFEFIASNLKGLQSEIESGFTADELDAMDNEERAARVGYDAWISRV